ncbi:MAG TPA: hypothetical protein ENF80_03060 [Thermofilum sp.]|nr:hypothetical protein [Thermofilum sp.]
MKNLKNSNISEDVLALDIVRALLIYHGVLWMSEIPRSLSNIRRGAIPYVITGESVLRALKRLEKNGIVKLEKKTRGKALSPTTYEDLFISLINMKEASKELREDPIIMAYKYRISRSLKICLINSSGIGVFKINYLGVMIERCNSGYTGL